MPVIFIIIIILFLVLIGWTWHSLGSIEKKEKTICIIVGIIIVYLITFVIFNISKIGIYYEDKTVMKVIRNVFGIIFTIVNGYMILPYIFKKLDQIKNDEIEKKQLIKSLIILIIVIVIIAIFETRYLGNIQKGILEIMNR